MEAAQQQEDTIRTGARSRSPTPDERFIHTHVGFGYRFAPEASRAFHNPGGEA